MENVEQERRWGGYGWGWWWFRHTEIRDEKVDGFLRPNGGEDELPPHFSEDEIENLAELMPAIKTAAASGHVSRNQVFSFVTVDTIVGP